MGLPARPLPSSRLAFEELRERLRSTAMPVRGERLASALPALDRALGGGFTKGTLTMLEGPAGSGRWALATRLLAQGTQRGLAAVIDSGALYPPDLVAAGVALERLVIVSAAAPVAAARAADALLRSRACGVVALDAPTLRSSLWVRLAGLAHKSGALLLVVAMHAQTELAAVAGLRLRCERAGNEFCFHVRHESVRIPCSP